MKKIIAGFIINLFFISCANSATIDGKFFNSPNEMNEPCYTYNSVNDKRLNYIVAFVDGIMYSNYFALKTSPYSYQESYQLESGIKLGIINYCKEYPNDNPSSFVSLLAFQIVQQTIKELEKNNKHVTITPTPQTITPSYPNNSNNYYRNSDGDEIHRPEYHPENNGNGTAICRDGSESYSAHHSGTCSHHGGVARWER